MLEHTHVTSRLTSRYKLLLPFILGQQVIALHHLDLFNLYDLSFWVSLISMTSLSLILSLEAVATYNASAPAVSLMDLNSPSGRAAIHGHCTRGAMTLEEIPAGVICHFFVRFKGVGCISKNGLLIQKIHLTSSLQ